MTETNSRGLGRETAERLLRSARAVREHAYAPYSNFPVGAALLADDGRIFTGVNVENASYGLTTCAERSAVARAMSDGARAFRAIAVVGPEDDVGCLPCGSCRQILHEIGPDLIVITPGGSSGPQEMSMGELLPGAFGAERLDSSRLR